MTPTMATAMRRLDFYKRYRAATTTALERKQNITAIILAERACAWHCLAGGDAPTACEHLANARWFAARDYRSARQAWDTLRYARPA